MKKIVLFLVVISSLTLFAKQNNTISKKSYESLKKAQELIQKNSYSKAKNILLPLLKKTKSDYEKSYIFQTLSNISINQNNYKQAAKYYEKIIALNSFEPKNIQRIKFSLAKIYLSLNKYSKSINLFNELLKAENIKKSTIYENLMFAYFYKKDYKKVLKTQKTLFSLEKKIKESWYQILYSSYIELKDYKSAIVTLKTMVKKWHSNENYWLQLISLYQQTKQLKKALSAFELAYKKGGLNPKKNTLYFANILIQNNLYHKAALQIEEAMNNGNLEKNAKNFDIMVSCYNNARQLNKVIKLLNSSSLGKTVKYQLLLGNIYYNQEKYENSIDVLKKINIKKGTKKDGQRNTLIALDYYELNNKKATLKYLNRAIKNPYEKKRALNIKKSLQMKI